MHYRSDLERVEAITLEVARELLVFHEWGVDDYKTFFVYTKFDDSSIHFTVMLRARSLSIVFLCAPGIYQSIAPAL
jgi:small-conductance mechanosensitive channel